MAEQNVTEAIAEVMDNMEAVQAAVVGYRDKLKAAGFTEPAAERMAETLYTKMTNALFAHTDKMAAK